MNVFVFDIETVPDVDGARKLWNIEGLDDEEVANVMFSKRQQETEGRSDFIRHHLQKIVAISGVLRIDDRLNVWSLGDVDSSESDLIRRFYEGIERFTPVLVSWNGGGFDLPVLHYRTLFHGINAQRYWDTGSDDPSFRFNNYLGRFHWRHIDLMDVISGYQGRATARLDDIASLLGYPGKIGMTGKDVWRQYLDGNVTSIRDYCETDVLNTYLVYLNFERMRGHLLDAQFSAEVSRLRSFLAEANQAHLTEFLEAWEA
ncbi:MAG: putative PolB exonuclease-like 3'-5' exonuclease [Gammaproteobacteria bacterium]|jgi:predicted PolB exonuclease-like 3'-5' exonuclease